MESNALKIIDKSYKASLLGLAYVYMQHQHYADAKALWKAMLEFSPFDQKVLLSLAYCCLKEGSFEESLAWIHRCETHTQIEPHFNDSIALIKAKAMWGLGARDKAHEISQEFLERRSHHG